MNWDYATTGLGDANTTDSWPIVGGSGQPPGHTLRFTVGDGPPQDTVVNEYGNWDWTPQSAIPDGDHDVTLEVLDASGEVVEESSWEWDIQADQATRERDAVRAQRWREGGRQAYFQNPNDAPSPDQAAFMRQGPLTGGGGGGAGNLVAAGAGGAAALTGTAEKGNAGPQVEKGNAE